nr:aldo/keto reductase [Segetibacter sp.]
MNYKQLGKSALEVSEISFGCMSLKRSQQENERIIDKATELGINYFDTADLYDKGMNEESIG